MQLLTKELEASIPRLNAQERLGLDAVVHVKFFTPWSRWTWYATEYDPGERRFFGLVDGHERELGYFSLDELEAIKGPGGLGVERDLYFKPQTIRQLVEEKGWKEPWS